MTAAQLIDVNNLKVHFPIYSTGLFRKLIGHVKAVDDVSFSINRGETLGLVGESGSGKTTVGRAILRALDTTDGAVTFHKPDEAIDLLGLRQGSLRRFRKHMQLIFQDPYASLNPRMTVRDIIAEPLECQSSASRAEVDERVREVAARCKLNVEHLRRFPHAFSGGQRQRICIARALVTNPEFIVCDESVSALDVSIQAEILNLLMDLQEQLGLTYLFIAHDLSVVAQIASRVAVMYVGRFVEWAPTQSIFFAPKHPYTRALLSAVPTMDTSRPFDPIKLTGEIPNPANPPTGCRFHTRCPYADAQCRNEVPEWREIAPEHFVACHKVEQLELGVQITRNEATRSEATMASA
ncbi:MAG: oligopeptide/dipeptide ABC transporter ATP-binding protein [Candidatus Competibacteraceae bacterium]|jgi:oligopeptide/dipeptide ABC transporter ATP-binding protein|nr:oligopeptide/dipeptide ABC transporter ATP-binding protein [Candidatus Competibacteraceae bacterium]